MMKTSAALIAFLLTAGAFAQEAPNPPPRPDYSKEAIQKILLEAESRSRVRFRVGAVEFRALGMSWQFDYIPGLFMPLSGTRPGVTQEWPDPFSLTHTLIATSPRAARRGREFNRELRKINERLKASVKVKSE
jgi:hypothetical protein